MSVKFSSCGNHLVSFGNDRNIRLWHTHSGKMHAIKFARGCHSRMKYQVDIFNISGANEDILLYPDDRSGDILITPLHSSTGEPIGVLSGHMDMVSAVQILPDATVVSCGRDGMIFVWEPLGKRSDAAATDGAGSEGSVRNEKDNWSEDDDDDDDNGGGGGGAGESSTSGGGRSKRRFQPNILRMYREDAGR